MWAEIQARWTAHIFYESRYKSKYSKHCVIHLRPISWKQEYYNYVHTKEAVIKVDGVCFKSECKNENLNHLKPLVYFVCRERHAIKPVHIKNVFWDKVHFHNVASKNILYPTPFCTLFGDKPYMTLECVTIPKCQGEKVVFFLCRQYDFDILIFFFFF